MRLLKLKLFWLVVEVLLQLRINWLELGDSFNNPFYWTWADHVLFGGSMLESGWLWGDNQRLPHPSWPQYPPSSWCLTYSWCFYYLRNLELCFALSWRMQWEYFWFSWWIFSFFGEADSSSPLVFGLWENDALLQMLICLAQENFSQHSPPPNQHKYQTARLPGRWWPIPDRHIFLLLFHRRWSWSWYWSWYWPCWLPSSLRSGSSRHLFFQCRGWFLILLLLLRPPPPLWFP